MSPPMRARHAERGQTLPIWTLAVLTALTLMFFTLNYANTIRWQVRAQNAADAAATAALSVQATQWNKLMALMYTADIEEWRIRHLIHAMYDVANGNGGCSMSGGSCLKIYQKLQPQYYKAVNRYTTDVKMMQSVASIGQSSQAADATKIIQSIAASCGYGIKLADCAFSYHIVDYSYRATTQQAGKDAFYARLGDFTSPQDSTPVADWEPAQMEIATCATVQPLVNFSIFGYGPKPFTVIGRSAATNVSQTAEWFTPGAVINPATGTAYQLAENYDPADDTFASTSSPRDWYETNYPSIPFTAAPAYDAYQATLGDTFDILMCWWSAIPELPYTLTAQTKTGLCTQS